VTSDSELFARTVSKLTDIAVYQKQNNTSRSRPAYTYDRVFNEYKRNVSRVRLRGRLILRHDGIREKKKQLSFHSNAKRLVAYDGEKRKRTRRIYQNTVRAFEFRRVRRRQYDNGNDAYGVRRSVRFSSADCDE